MNKKLLWNLFKYVLAIGLLTYVVWSNWDPAKGSSDPAKSRGLKYVYETHVVQGVPIHYGYFALAVTICLAAVLLTFARWYLLVRAVGLPFRLTDALRLGAIGFFFNTFLPGAVGGDIIKAAFLAREHSRRTVAVATVIMDRAIALWALVWFVAIMGTIFWASGVLQGDAERQSKTIVVSAAVIVGVSLLVWFALGLLPPWRAERFAGRLHRLPKVGGSAAEFWRAVWMYRQQQGSVAKAMLISWVGHVGFVLTFYFCSLTLLTSNGEAAAEQIPTLAEHFLIVPIGLVIQAMPLFPGGAGIGELGFGGLYRWFGSPDANGVLGSLVQRVIYWILGLMGYLVYLRMKTKLPPVTEEAEPLVTAEASSY